MRRYTFDLSSEAVFEDELPEDMTDDDYARWFKLSWVDGVRLGPKPERLSESEDA